MPGQLSAVRRQLIREVRKYGVLETARHAARKLRTDFQMLVFRRQADVDPFDGECGTETAAVVRVGSLDIPDDRLEHTNRYEAVMPAAFDLMMRELAVQHEEFVFIDIGSGKGRAVLLASRYPFQRVTGVELSGRLVEIAQNNLRIFRDHRQQCRAIEIVRQDALSYDLPPVKMLLFFYNPFGAEVMRAMVNRVEQSLRQCPRKLYVIYHRPMHREPWDNSGSFRILRSAEGYAVYESVAA